MNKDELVEALIKAGIVSSNPDGTGAKIFVTVNDYDETMGEKKDRERRNKLLSISQFWVTIITALCLILTTAYSIYSSQNRDDYKYFERRNYILRYSPESGRICAIPENERVQARLQLKEIAICGQ